MKENQKPVRAGRLVAGHVLGALLAMAAPILVLSELMSLLPVASVGAVGVALLYRWFGGAPALFSALLQIFVCAMMLGGTGMWIAIFLSLLPLVALYAAARRPFFEQLRISIAAFMLGVLLAVICPYSTYGGNAVERALRLLPEALRMLPTERLDMLQNSLSAQLGAGATLEAFIDRFAEMIEQLIPVYQRNLPGMIFSGALITALICAVNFARARGGECAPLREWALPASTTGGLLLILVVSYVLAALNVRGGTVAFQTVFDIAATAFCVQALASMARHMQRAGKGAGWQRGIVAVIGVLAYFGASLYVAIYGCASAIFGSRGALRQRKPRA